VATAKERLEKIKRGESVAGGLGKKMDREAMIKAMGITENDALHFMRIASLTEAELKLLPGVEAMDKAKRRAVRRILRARK
jgi:hypothetical protein